MCALTLNDKATKLLAGKNLGYLATLNKDGSPQVTPVMVDREGDLILVNTTPERAKARNTKRDPRVAIAIADASNQLNMVTYRGRVVEQTTKGAKEHTNKLTKRYLGQDRYPGTEQRVILKIRPEPPKLCSLSLAAFSRSLGYHASSHLPPMMIESVL